MARRFSNDRTDRLYQLPPNDFTRERNALAKAMGGDEGRRLKSLPKPTASAWAVNQLYWRDRETYDALIGASERLRSAHRAVLGGRKADLTGADAAHREAVKAALTSALRLARDAGQTISAGTHTEIAQTLESLTEGDAGGRLAKPLRPRGFEALQGFPVQAIEEKPARATEKPSRQDDAAEARRLNEEKRAIEGARRQERRDRAAVARLQKQITTAERTSAAATAALERARSDETRLRNELRQAQDSLERSARELQHRTKGPSR